VTVEELLPELVADREFYIVSGGGITLSGGEPLLQPAFAAELVAACRAHGLDVVLDTSGYSSWEHLKTLATQCSLVLYDVKSLDADRHLAGTGKPLDTVLCNLMSLVQLIGPDRTILRCPLVPGFNNRPQDFQALSHLAAKLGTAVEILPFHRLGTAKYEVLGQPIPSNLPDAQMAAAEATNLCHELRARGIACRVT
jgi:pyruvate formate lyase activating enzyme